MKTKLLFTFLLISFMSFAQGTGEVIITEIHNRPEKPDQALLDAAFLLPENSGSSASTSRNEAHTEWFEVYNTTGSPVVMDGWKIIDGSNNAETIIGTFTLAAGDYAMFTGFYIPAAQGGVVPDYVYEYKKPSFNNESTYSGGSQSNCPDGVILTTGADVLVDQVLYDYGYGSYIYDDGGGDGIKSHCSKNSGVTPFGFPAQGGSSKISFQLDGGFLNAIDNDNPAYWSFTIKDGLNEYEYDVVNSQYGSPGEANYADPSLSTDDVLANEFKVYPNPAKDYVSIQSKKKIVTSVDLYNVLGAKVLTSKLSNGRINVSSLVKGVYFMNINAEGGSATKKLVIQ